LVNITYVPTYFKDFCYMFMYVFCILILHKNPGFTDDVNILGKNIQKNTEALLDASKEVGLEVNSEKTKYMLM
jgi:hypothetical protein